MKKIIIAVAFLIATVSFYFWPKKSAELDSARVIATHEAKPATDAAQRAIASGSAPGAITAKGEARLADSPLNEGEKKSIATLMGLLARTEEVGKSPRALFDALGQAGLKPMAAKDTNEYTGTLWTIRTDNTLPGTRYFHAQLFGEGETHMQHASFEIRPGSDSMNTAVELVRQANPELGRPEIEREDYVLWKKKGGKVISVKRLNAEELRDSRFNAHAPEDAGTIWVTSEDEPSHDLAQF